MHVLLFLFFSGWFVFRWDSREGWSQGSARSLRISTLTGWYIALTFCTLNLLTGFIWFKVFNTVSTITFPCHIIIHCTLCKQSFGGYIWIYISAFPYVLWGAFISVVKRYNVLLPYWIDVKLPWQPDVYIHFVILTGEDSRCHRARSSCQHREYNV